MKLLSLLTFTIVASLLTVGCSSKKYFEPEKASSASNASASYGGHIVNLSRDGGTLTTGQYLSKEGVSTLKMDKGYRFLSQNSAYVLTANPNGILKIIDKKTQQAVRSVDLLVPVVSSSIKGDKIAYILNNNTFGIYSIKNNKKIIESRSELSYAIDTRSAMPIFVDNLVVMPMLDGKLIIMDTSNTDNSKVVYISSATMFNNVIYLSRMGNTMVSATPKGLITLGDEGKNEYRANISEVAINKNHIYLFTKEGEIIKLTSNLKVSAKVRHKFAHYAVATAFGDRVYALDQQGSLIVMNSSLTQQKIYKLGSINEPAFITGTKLYKDGKVIELSQLGYE